MNELIKMFLISNHEKPQTVNLELTFNLWLNLQIKKEETVKLDKFENKN